MGRLIKIVVALALAWVGVWLVMGFGIRLALSSWFEDQRTRSWQAEYAQMGTSGFPWRSVTRIDALALADPGTGVAWSADWLEFESPTAWPGRQDVRFADTEQVFAYFDQRAGLTAQDMTARLHLHLGLALELERMGLTAGPWKIVEKGKVQISADTLVLTMEQSEVHPSTYAVAFAADRFAPGNDLRDFLRATSSLPDRFETFTMDMAIRFSRPWDRSAIEVSRPQPEEIKLRLADVKWGAMRIMAAGTLTVDEQGVPTGVVSVKLENWREILEMAQMSGILPPSAADSAEKALNLLAALTGARNALDLQLNFQNGLMALGPLPLGEAPRLILR